MSPRELPFDSDAWRRANRRLSAKILSELAHECLIAPVRIGDSALYQVPSDDGERTYSFRARRMGLDHWSVDETSVECAGALSCGAWDAADLILDLRETLELHPPVLETYLEELTCTASMLARHFANECLDARRLASADFQEIEGAMSAGHPCFLANGGRIGFSLDDSLAYAPELAPDFSVVWVAAHRDRAHFAAISTLTYETVMREELGVQRVDAFDERLRALALDPDDYILMPVHPWQWAHRITTGFSDEIACRRLVFLGESDDRYQPQQSVRTLFNRSAPHRRYVKCALSVLNMGFMRGLSPEYMRSTPAINEWVHETVANDPKLDRFYVLREVATAGYRHPRLERSAPRSSARRKMLAALWRESPYTRVDESTSLMTMAALLHRDRKGEALLPELVSRSGLSPEAWL
ncbi:MAG: IucA/IucC family protein, partial [Myxococcota bacterium]